MRHGSMNESRSERGFSLIELLIVVAIIVIMAAVALPNVVGFMRNYRLNGALREVSNQKECSAATARLNSAWAAGLHVTGKLTVPSFSATPCCWPAAAPAVTSTSVKRARERRNLLCAMARLLSRGLSRGRPGAA